MKHNKNADALLFLLSFTKVPTGKNVERIFFASAGAKKRVRNSGFWDCLTAISAEFKK